MPSVPPEQIRPADISLLYPFSRSFGPARRAIPTTDAPTMPVVAARITQTKMTANPSPPFMGPMTT